MKEITVQKYIQEAKTESNRLLVDVRTQAEFEAEHLPDAVNIPLEDLQMRLNELPQEGQIFLICRSGARSGFAQQILAARGITNTYNIVDGMIGR